MTIYNVERSISLEQFHDSLSSMPIGAGRSLLIIGKVYYVAVTGRKRTVSGLIRVVISLECFIEITPDFLCPFMND